MCGRFAIVSPARELQKAFNLAIEPKNLGPRYNAAPGQMLPVIPNTKPRAISLYRWGLVPPWARDSKAARPLINARAETLWEKNSFSNAIASRRCIVPADGFYEWKNISGGKIPFFFRSIEKRIFALAGLWESGEKGSQLIYSFTIITTEPNDLVSKIHNRMPAIVEPGFLDIWLSQDRLEQEDTGTILKPLDQDGMEAFEVPGLVNSISKDGPELIEKVKTRTMEQMGLF